MSNEYGRNNRQGQIAALLLRQAAALLPKTAAHIKENGLQGNRNFRRHEAKLARKERSK
jgi:hypothetical protein